MRRFLTLILVLALGLSSLGAAAAAGAEPHNSELWHLTTVTDPTNHKFTYCAVESIFDNHFSLAFARNRDLNTNIVVTFPDKRLTDHTKFRMSVLIAPNPPREFVGFSANPETLVIPLQHDRTVVQWLQKGKLLELQGPEDAIKFALDGADDALHKLQLCVESNVKAETANAGGKPEARPQVAPVPVAADTAPAADQAIADQSMVEPLPLPGQPATDQKPPVASVLTTGQPEPAIAPAAPPVVAPAPPPSPQGNTQYERDDEIAARAAAARLTALRQQAAEADAAKAQADAKAKADAEAARIAAAKEQAAKDQAAKDEAARQQAAQAQKRQQQQDAQRQAADDAAAKAALAKLQADQAAAKAKDQTTQQAAQVAVVSPPAPAEPATTPAVERPAVASLALAPQTGKPAATLFDLLRQAGVTASAIDRQPGSYAWKLGAIAGEATETRSKKPFLDALLDNVDSLEKGCHGPFSSTIGAPVQKPGVTYAEVTTGCSGITGIVLYYEKAARFGVIAQETIAGDGQTAATIRQRLESGLSMATKYQ
jgi:hypothetical protein